MWRCTNAGARGTQVTEASACTNSAEMQQSRRQLLLLTTWCTASVRLHSGKCSPGCMGRMDEGRGRGRSDCEAWLLHASLAWADAGPRAAPCLHVHQLCYVLSNRLTRAGTAGRLLCLSSSLAGTAGGCCTSGAVSARRVADEAMQSAVVTAPAHVTSTQLKCQVPTPSKLWQAHRMAGVGHW